MIGEGGTVATNKALARRLVLETYGWDEQQYMCLEQLWIKESSWNHKAANPTSSARGIAQTMMSLYFPYREPGSTENTWWRNPKAQEFMNSPSQQIVWGLNYIRDRKNYGTPCAAWDFWLVNKWY